MKRLGIVFMREAEVVRALRSNVSELQGRLNRTRYHLGRIDAKRAKLAKQLKLDRVYIERVKAAAFAVLKSEDEDESAAACEVLRLALHAAVDPSPATLASRAMKVSDREALAAADQHDIQTRLK